MPTTIDDQQVSLAVEFHCRRPPEQLSPHWPTLPGRLVVPKPRRQGWTDGEQGPTPASGPPLQDWQGNSHRPKMGVCDSPRKRGKHLAVCREHTHSFVTPVGHIDYRPVGVPTHSPAGMADSISLPLALGSGTCGSCAIKSPLQRKLSVSCRSPNRKRRPISIGIQGDPPRSVELALASRRMPPRLSMKLAVRT